MDFDKLNRDLKRRVDKIIIHASDTYEDMDIGKIEITQWHIMRGFSDIGYHFVIRRDGTIELGRNIDLSGAHCKGYNNGSIGICLVGGKSRIDDKPEDNFKDEQFNSLDRLLSELLWFDNVSSEVSIKGHNYYANRGCPCFDVEKFKKDRGF